MKKKHQAIMLGAVLVSLCTTLGGEDRVKKQEKKIKNLIENLVLVHEKASDRLLISPGIAGDDDKEYANQFEKCQLAFSKLSDLKGAAFPYLVEHLGDKRPSIQFRNHYPAHSVGNACYWNLYFQLQDRPDDYSSYGLAREGRDGKDHVKPYWEGTPFDDAGGVAEWLKENQKLTYPQLQIKCLQWLLDKEKAIGAPNPESYFENILPLEIRILERKLETGAKVQKELDRLRSSFKRKAAADVPTELLPAGIQ